MRRQPVWCLIAVTLAGLGLGRPSFAATIAVTEVIDNIDPADKHCSLREAIITANTNKVFSNEPGECVAGDDNNDTITLDARTYQLTIVGQGEDNAFMGDLDILGNLAIRGVHADKTIVHAGGVDRVFDILGAVTVTFEQLSIVGGNPGAGSNGGGITTNNASANITLTACRVADNVGAAGGGIYGPALVSTKQSVIANNTASLKGGGAYISGTGRAGIVSSVIIQNAATTGDGGGFFVEASGRLTMTLSSVVANSAKGSGGGIASAGVATISKSALYENTAEFAAGIWNDAGKLMMFGSSVFKNTATATAGGVSNGGDATLKNVTIGFNQALFAGGLLMWGTGKTLTLQNVLLAGNASTNVDGAAPECRIDGGIVTSLGTNLFGPNACAIVPAAGDIVGHSAAFLQPLINNEIAGYAHVPLDDGSVAIDAGNAGVCDGTATLVKDQLNRARVGPCDIGAVEAICGDGTKQAFSLKEQCDDGNLDNADECLTTCKLASCGDGFLHAGVEQCDDGAKNSNTLADACRTTCKKFACGDGVADSGELCDDGNLDNTDGCLTTCTVASCGDGFVQAVNKEECDLGTAKNVETGECLPTCVKASCGDGFLLAGKEICDDKNTDSGDGCRADCLKIEVCGDGILHAALKEACDDGNLADGDGCSKTCAIEPPAPVPSVPEAPSQPSVPEAPNVPSAPEAPGLPSIPITPETLEPPSEKLPVQAPGAEPQPPTTEQPAAPKAGGGCSLIVPTGEQIE